MEKISQILDTALPQLTRSGTDTKQVHDYRESIIANMTREEIHAACMRKQQYAPFCMLELPSTDATLSTQVDCYLQNDPRCPYFDPDFEKKERVITLNNLGFGKIYQQPELEKIRPRKSIEKFCVDLEGNLKRGKSLVIVGKVGVGKTCILSYLALQISELDYRQLYYFTPNLFSDLHPGGKGTPRETRDKVERFGVLHLDDLGTEYVTTFTLAMFEGIVEHYHANRKPIFVTTNLTPEVLRKREGWERIADRLLDKAEVVIIKGNSMRRH